MRYLPKITGLLFMVILLCNCFFYSDEVKDNPYGIKAYSQTEIDSIIDNHPYTIIFAWELGCGPCRNYLQNDVIPYLSVKPDTIGFISITNSSYSKVVHFMEKYNYKVSTFIYKDTITNPNLSFYHYWFPSVLPSYEYLQHEGVPQTIVCNNKREILNIDESIAFDALGDTIQGRRYAGINWCIEHFDEIIRK